VELPVQPLAGATVAPSKSVTLTLSSNAAYVLSTNTTAEIRVLREAAISVKDFGAAGDGVTDDTAAVQAAIAALEASTNQNTLYFPDGTYRLNTPSIGTWNLFNPPIGYAYFVELGRTNLAGRDLFFVGQSTNAVLYSTVSWMRTRILMAHASFRTLSFRTMTFRKEPNPLPPPVGDNAEGIFVLNQDRRRVESVDILQCTFDNCHSSVRVNGPGHDIRGQLGHFRLAECSVLNPYGCNTTNATPGGGAQVILDSWVREALYYNNLFVGNSDNNSGPYNPSGVRKDGSAFGSPLNMVFTNNIVRQMNVEAVFQTDDPFMSTTINPFVVPDPGAPATNIAVQPYPTTFVPGQILNFRTWPPSGADNPTNVLLTVAAFDPITSSVTITNTALTPLPSGTVVTAMTPIYLQDYDPTSALISGNLVHDPTQTGYVGICCAANGKITRNFVRGYRYCINQYPNDHNPYRPPTPGTLIASNIITTDMLGVRYGVLCYGPGTTISQNLMVRFIAQFIGISVRSTNVWVRGNVALSRLISYKAYDSAARSVGVAFYQSSDTTSMDNRTYGFDVGIGPEVPYDIVPHRVISHFSVQDQLPIDPLGVY
jgi:hypothetical protein